MPRVAFEEVERLATDIEGMTSIFSMRVMDAVLSHQRTAGVTGNLIEFGVYKGKSAAVISAHVAADERFILVDVDRQITPETMSRLFAPAEFVSGRSEDFSREYRGFSRLRRSARFMHIDSSHRYRTTLAEMKLLDRLLAPDGVACLDDYTNLNYSQILPAIFKHLYTSRSDLTMFLVTNEKAYLCRKPFFRSYANFVLRELHAEMMARGSDPLCLARTDADPEYAAFYLRGKLTPEEGDHYGESLYRNLYEAP